MTIEYIQQVERTEYDRKEGRAGAVEGRREGKEEDEELVAKAQARQLESAPAEADVCPVQTAEASA